MATGTHKIVAKMYIFKVLFVKGSLIGLFQKLTSLKLMINSLSRKTATYFYL